jgi:uncharacterized repeat protein (TIGR01451 family)
MNCQGFMVSLFSLLLALLNFGGFVAANGAGYPTKNKEKLAPTEVTAGTRSDSWAPGETTRYGRAALYSSRLKGAFAPEASPTPPSVMFLENAEEIVSGETKTGNIASAGQIDSYWFLANAGDTVTILIGEERDHPVNYFAPQVQLVGPGGGVATASAWGTSSARIRLKKVAQSGRYFILCDNHGGTETHGYGVYGVSLLKNPGTATFAIQSGETKKRSITSAGQMDVYSFIATAGDAVTILMGKESDDPSNYFAPQVELHAPDGSIVKALSGDGFACIPGEKLSQAGTYFVVCRNREGTGTNGYGDYGVSLLKNPGTASFPIQSGETKKGSITSAGQMDSYIFTANAGDTVTILMGEEGDDPLNYFAPQVELHAPDGSVVEALSGDASASIQGQKVNQTGTYFIVCRDREGTATNGYGSYGVSLLKNPGTASFSIQPRETKRGNIASAGQMDVYSFTANAGDTVNILMEEEGADPLNYFAPHVELRAPDGSVVKALSGDTSASIQGQKVNQTGTCFIVCRDRKGAGTLSHGAYRVSLMVVPGDPGPDLHLAINHTGTFTAGTNARYTLAVTNRSTAATTGRIRLADTLPAGLTFVSGGGGLDWSCSASGQVATCARTNPLPGGESSNIFLEIEVDGSAVPRVINTATVATEGDTNSGNDTAADTAIVEGSWAGTASKVLLLRRAAADATTDYFNTLLTSNGIAYTEASPGNQLALALSENPVIIAAFSAEPTEFKSYVSLIIEALARGSWMIAEAYGKYIPHYAGIGSAKTTTWSPVVLDKWAFIKGLGSSPLFQNLPAWDPAELPDRPQQYLYSVEKAGSKTRIDYTHPATGLSLAEYLGMNITYGWTGQATDSHYCNDWGGCTAERSVRQASTSLVHYGKGKFMMLMSDPVAAGAFQYGKAAGLIYQNFIRQGLGTMPCVRVLVVGQPQSPTIGSGHAVTLSVAAIGTAPLFYQWYKGQSGYASNPIAGATSSAYTTSPLYETATYWVQVGNSCSSVQSSTSTVSVAGIPAAPSNLRATTVSCNQVDLSWSDNSADERGFRIERKIGSSGTWSEIVRVAANTPSYKDTRLSSGTDYHYRLQALNEVGFSPYSNEAMATSTTNVPPSITSQPQSQSVVSGQTATLSVTATGTTPLSYQWYRGNKGDTANPIYGATSSTYATPALTTSTSFWVRVSNPCASVDSNTATITAVPCVAPSITAQPQSLTIQSGQTATLSVTAAGITPLSYQWYRGNKGDTSNPISGATSSTYTTPALTATTTYWVRVSNDCGSIDSATATVTVQPAPDLKITKSHSGNFTVGSSGAYTLTVTNVGTAATTGTITVSDTLPAGLSYVSAAGANWSCSASGQNVTCTRTTSLAAGATAAITLTVGVLSTAYPTVTNTVTVTTSGDANSGNNTYSDATTVVLPALPAVTVSGLGTTVTPASQQSVTVRLASGYPLPVSGQLQLTFTPEVGILADDPAILFATGGRTVDFTIAANSTQALFSNNQTSVGAQTGTVAGTISIKSTLRYLTTDLTPSPAPGCSGKVDKVPPAITNISASRTGSGFRVVIVGHSTPRQMTGATFRFTATSDVDLRTQSIPVDLSQAFSTWYQRSDSAQYGSLFSLTIDFTVEGPANAIIAVSATLTNAQGIGTEKSVSF